MLHPSTKRLIDKLSEMTRKQRVTWTEGENAAVVHDTEGYRVVITPDPHAVLLTDALGREIETCTPEEFADDVDSHGRPYAKFVAELYREAARHARGTEKAIRTLLAGLDSAEAEAPAPTVSVVPGVQVIDVPDATTDETAPIESETEITAAVATLADQINSAPAAPAPEAVAAPQPEPEPVIAVHVPEPEPEPEPVPEPAPAFVEVAEIVAEMPAPSVEVAPLAEEPGSFGTFGAFEPVAPEPELAPEPETEPALGPIAAEAVPAVESPPEPVLSVTAPEPEPEPQPTPTPAPPVPTLSQPISLSSIPFGFGLGAAQRAGTPSHPSITPPDPEPHVSAEAPARLVIDGTLDLPDLSPEDFDSVAAAEPYPPPAPRTDPLELPGESPPPAPEPGNPRRFNPWN
jgi:hypothetical protein